LPLKIDLHVHTNYSYDSVITPEELMFYAKKRGLDGVAITDHDRLDGALKIAERADFFIIPGTEITSSEGHIVALNVENPISKGLDAGETVDEIHRAGGLAVACHPATLYKGSLGMHTREKFDAVEVINASAFPFNLSVKRAKRLASELQASEVAGTDAHYGPEIGYAYTMIEAEQTVDGVMEAIHKGLCQPFGRAIPWRLRLKRFFATRGS
jgi:hypothetical protein